MQKYLGSMVVPQHSKVGINPLNGRKRAVLTSQEYKDFENPGLFYAYRPEVNREAYFKLINEYPGIENLLRELPQQGLKMFDEEGLLPDTSGLNNFVVSNGEFISLGGAHRPAKQSEITRMVGQLRGLAELTSND